MKRKLPLGLNDRADEWLVLVEVLDIYLSCKKRLAVPAISVEYNKGYLMRKSVSSSE